MVTQLHDRTQVMLSRGMKIRSTNSHFFPVYEKTRTEKTCFFFLLKITHELIYLAYIIEGGPLSLQFIF